MEVECAWACSEQPCINLLPPLTANNSYPYSLALAEIKALLVAVYQQYSTVVSHEFQHLSPTATSRFELVYDDLFPISEVCSISRLPFCRVEVKLLMPSQGGRMPN